MITRRFGFAAAFLAALVAALPAQARQMTSEVTELDTLPRARPQYPVPNEPNMVFYIERSSNSNTVIYCANLDKDGKLNKNEPIVAYWRWYNKGGYIKQLNFAERMLAYGIKSVKHDGPEGSYSFRIAALPERTIYIGLDGNGHPEVFGKVGNHWAKLVYVFLEVDDSGVLPDVPTLDFYGYDKTTGKAVREHIIRH